MRPVLAKEQNLHELQQSKPFWTTNQNSTQTVVSNQEMSMREPQKRSLIDEDNCNYYANDVYPNYRWDTSDRDQLIYYCCKDSLYDEYDMFEVMFYEPGYSFCACDVIELLYGDQDALYFESGCDTRWSVDPEYVTSDCDVVGQFSQDEWCYWNCDEYFACKCIHAPTVIELPLVSNRIAWSGIWNEELSVYNSEATLTSTEYMLRVYWESYGTAPSEIVTLTDVPILSEYEACDLCDLGEDPCSGPTSGYDCWGEICPSLIQRCSTILDPNDRVTTDSTAIVSELLEICPQVSTSPVAYKTEISNVLEPNDWDCLNFLQTEGGDYYELINLDNFFYVSYQLMEEACLEDPSVCASGQCEGYIPYDCYFPWLNTNEYSTIPYYQIMDLQDYNCLTFPENLSNIGDDLNPCLAYHDGGIDKLCALCKFNSIRIAIELYNGDKYVWCGSVRTPERDVDGVYEFLDVNNYEDDDIADNKYECFIHPYYKQNFPSEYGKASAFSYNPVYFYNITDVVEEYLCISTNQVVEQISCKHSGIKPTVDQLASLEDDEMNAIQLQIADNVAGCVMCKDNFVPIIEFDSALGYYVQQCHDEDEFDFSKANVPCRKIGYVQQWTGYIESEQTLECTLCSTLIPDCLVCETATSCSLCKPNFIESLVYDVDGVERIVCLKAFCGVEGYGTSCSSETPDTLTGCKKFKTMSVTEYAGTDNEKKWFKETCDICEPGYSQYIYTVFPSSTAQAVIFLQACRKREGSITENFFIRPELSTMFSDEEYLEMHEMHLQENRGRRWDDPLYMIQNAFAYFNDLDQALFDLAMRYFELQMLGGAYDFTQYKHAKYDQYEEVIFNIWLHKGTHHFIQCKEYLAKKYPDDVLAYDWLADISVDFTSDVNYIKAETNNFSSFCQYENSYFSLQQRNHVSDNLKFYVRPLECKLAKSTFKNMELGSEKDFYDNCVDLEAGDPKPEIRVHGTAMFNITNFGHFENIQFTGIDNMIEVTATDGSDETAQMYKDLLAVSPYKLCEMETEPTGHLETGIAETLEVGDDNFEYTCFSGFNITRDGVAMEVDTTCVSEAEPAEFKGVRGCQGEPAHEKFFEKSTHWVDFRAHAMLMPEFSYPYRHNVLFNLYGFDSVRSDRTHAPTLELENCDFSYFMDKQALIQVETNNFIEMATQFTESLTDQDFDVIDDQFIAHVGEDRGARIDISDSTFKHSRFCKGMISYRETDPISFEDEPKLFRFNAQVNRTADNEIDDGRSESFIRIKGSHFENLAYQQQVEQLTNLQADTFIGCGSDLVTSFFECVFLPYDHRGFVINAKGFNGTIQIETSTFERNMAYIQDYLSIENSQENSDYLQPKTIQYSQFEDGLGYLNFKVCNSQNKGEYLINKLADQHDEFDDAGFDLQYESISTLMIIGNKGPVIIRNNTFEENIGTLGGAIHIRAPDFESNAGLLSENRKPYVYIGDNNFVKNMAYFAGNALYMTHEVNRSTSWKDYLNTCGAGVMITANSFLDNIGMKKHNGGAAVNRCIQLYGDEDSAKTSSLPLEQRDKTDDDEGDFEYYYEDPDTTTDLITDQFDSSVTYEVIKHATVYQYNQFKRNRAGMKGSALLASELTNLKLIENQFQDNSPVISLFEQWLSPYVKYLALSQKTLTMPIADELACDYTDNELQYIENCYDPLFNIDMPALKGAVYIDNCQGSTQCVYPLTEDARSLLVEEGLTPAEIKLQIADFRALHQVSTIRMYSEIRKNLFEENQILPIVQYTQTDEQTSCIYIKGGTNLIIGNDFVNHRQVGYDYIKANAPLIYEYVPENYFQFAQGPLISISYDAVESLSKDEDFYQTSFEANLFHNNQNTQVVLVDSQYRASLINFVSKIKNSQFKFASNQVLKNVFIGEGSSLIAIDGGLFDISGNYFAQNGQISQIKEQKHPDSIESDAFWPYPPYVFVPAQVAGVFSFYFDHSDLPTGQSHRIMKNTFSHNFCLQGCAYKAYGDKLHQINFKSNVYEYMVALDTGAVFDGSSYIQPDGRKDKVHLHFFENEQFSHTLGGAININQMNDAGVTLLLDCNFYENYGGEQAAVTIDSGGCIVAINTRFELDPSLLEIPQSLQDIKRSKKMFDQGSSFVEDPLVEATETQDYQTLDRRLISTYPGTQDDLTRSISLELLTRIASKPNLNGQVKLSDTFNDVIDIALARVDSLDMTFEELLLQYDIDSQLNTIYTIFINCVFKNLQGEQASAINTSSTSILIKDTTQESINFENNVSSQGSTIYVYLSEFFMQNISMKGNTGSKGGCLQLTSSSEVFIDNSYFSDNVALQGGVIFAIEKVIFRISNSVMERNIAQDGALLYGMGNQITFLFMIKFPSLQDSEEVDPPLGFVNSVIQENWSQSNLVHILLSALLLENCTVVDNYAQFVTHGITMISSQLKVEQTEIYFSEQGLEKVLALPIDKLDTGFFNLYLESSLTLSKGTVVRQMVGQKQSVLSAISQSSVFIHSDVLFQENNSISKEGYTMNFENTKPIEIADSVFIGNQQINIGVQNSEISLRNCTFTEGLKSHIFAVQSNLKLDQITIRDSQDTTIRGHGVTCQNCLDIEIKDSVFRNLTSQRAAAIYIKDSEQGAKALITGSTFEGNRVGQSGGAVRLDMAQSVTFSDNKFVGNKVEGGPAEWRFRDAGAIYFKCTPNKQSEYPCEVILDSNLFENNTAENKGGALRYINNNFTTVFKEVDSGRRLLSQRHLQDEGVVDTNTYRDNQAAYANDLASYPSSYRYTFTQNGKNYTFEESDQVTIAAGQALELLVQIFDVEGRLCSDEDDAVCNLEFQGGQDLTEGSVIVNPSAVSKGGQLRFDALQIRQKPDSKANINLVFTNLQTFGNSVDVFDSPVAHELYSRTCQDGESYGEALTCLPCEPGFFLYKAQLEPGICEICLETQNCHRSNVTSPKPTYWRSSATTQNFLQCFNPEACLGGDEDHPVGTCAEGYDGIMCANCIDRYRRQGAFKCEECKDSDLNILMSLFYFLTLIAAVVTLVRMSMRGSSMHKPLASVYLKIFLNHFQILRAVSKIQFGWPGLIQYILDAQQLIASLPTEVISFDCLLIDFVTGPDPDIRFNYVRIAFFYVLPLIVILISGLFWYCRGQVVQMTMQQQTDKTISTIMIIWFLFYPTIVGRLADSINCTKIEDTYRLYDDLEEECFQGRHLGVIYGISIPGLTLWAFGVPLLGFVLMRRFLREIASKSFLSDPSVVAELKARFKMRLGFLTQGYKEEYYYWEVVLLLRKTILVLMLTFMAPVSAGVQSLCAILLLVVSLVVQIKHQPFYDKKLNDLEAMSIVVQLIIIYFGLFYQSSQGDSFTKSDGTMYSVFLLVMIASVQFIGLFFVRMRTEMLKATVINYPCLFKMINCRSIKNVEAFKKQHKISNISFDNELKLKDKELKKAKRKAAKEKRRGQDNSVVYPSDVKVSVHKNSALLDSDLDITANTSQLTMKEQMRQVISRQTSQIGMKDTTDISIIMDRSGMGLIETDNDLDKSRSIIKGEAGGRSKAKKLKSVTFDDEIDGVESEEKPKAAPMLATRHVRDRKRNSQSLFK